MISQLKLVIWQIDDPMPQVRDAFADHLNTGTSESESKFKVVA